jgi:hypothetical protein
MIKLEKIMEHNNMSQEISYARFKERSTIKAVWHEDMWKAFKTTYVSGYDALMGKWELLKGKTTQKYLPISELGLHKRIQRVTYLKRTGNNENLMPIHMYFKRIEELTVKDPDSSVFLKDVFGRIFLTNLNLTFPVSYNVLNKELSSKLISETKLTATELEELRAQFNQKNQARIPVIHEQLQNGEIRISV